MAKSIAKISSPQFQQQGMALVLAMIILTVLTMLGITVMQTSNLEERMSSNIQQLNVAFQATETGLRTGEQWIDDQIVAPLTNDCSSNCASTDNVWPQPSATTFLDDVDDWDDSAWTAHGRMDTNLQSFPNAAEAPRRVLQETHYVRDSLTVGIGTPTGTSYYKVTSKGTGGTGVEDVRLQSTFVKRFN